MKGILHCGLYFFGVVSVIAFPEFCSLPKDEGTGNGIQFSFFYVKSEGLCHPFIFKGAGGNENRFQTDQECMRNCSEKHSYPVGREACSLEKDSGICLGRLLKFYYDKELKTCKSFIYGGCQGNGNRFETKEECRETCHVAGRSGQNLGQETDPDEASRNEGIIVGAIGGVIFLIALSSAIAFLVVRRKKKVMRKKVPTEVEMH